MRYFLIVFISIKLFAFETYLKDGHLTKALEIAKADMNSNDLSKKAIALSKMGDIYFAQAKSNLAQEYLTRAKEVATKSKDSLAIAFALNNYANFYSAYQNYDLAQREYENALEVVENRDLKITIMLNLYRLTLDNKLKIEIEKLLDKDKKIEHLISFALIDEDNSYLKKALKLAKDNRTKALILKHLGKNSIRLTKKALFLAQNYPQLSFLIEYQLANLYLKNSQKRKAKKALYRAKARLEGIKQELFVGFRESKDRFYDEIKPIYTLLIEIALNEINEQNREEKLKEIISIAEEMKRSEVDSMFLDECLSSARKELTLRDNEKIFYIITLKDKILVMLKSNNSIEYRVKSKNDFEKLLFDYRVNLQSRNHNRFLENAKESYNILIKEFEPYLKDVKTLAFVLDGKLRLIPPSTIFDGKKFLIERFNITNLLTIDLTDNSPLQKHKIFLGGISKAIDGFSPLTNVPKELGAIAKNYNFSVNLDENFTQNSIKNAIEKSDYNIIHFATHGLFTGEVDSTFLLTFNQNLTLDSLSSIIKDKNIDLLTLSACQSAIGDERSSLGLAGSSLKAGSKSAIASLWFVDDEATAILIDKFYQYLQSNSKALALRKAKLDLLSTKRFWHPSYWSAFILIGNWN